MNFKNIVLAVSIQGLSFFAAATSKLTQIDCWGIRPNGVQVTFEVGLGSTNLDYKEMLFLESEMPPYAYVSKGNFTLTQEKADEESIHLQGFNTAAGLLEREEVNIVGQKTGSDSCCGINRLFYAAKATTSGSTFDSAELQCQIVFYKN